MHAAQDTARHEALTAASFYPEPQTETSGITYANCPEKSRSVDTDVPASRSISKAAFPSALVGGTSVDKSESKPSCCRSIANDFHQSSRPLMIYYTIY